MWFSYELDLSNWSLKLLLASKLEGCFMEPSSNSEKQLVTAL